MTESATQTLQPAVRWPERFLPERAQVHVRNEIVIAAPLETVWAWLLRAELWPGWYANSSQIHFLSHAGPDLRNRSRLRWKTFGMRVTSKVLEFELRERLSWETQGHGLEAWHGWVLTRLGDGSTHVLSEETQTGWRASLGKLLMPNRLRLLYQASLDALSRQAQTGPPPLPEAIR